MKKLIYITTILLSFTFSSCSKSNEEDSSIDKRTVLIYMCAENNLDDGTYFSNDSTEIATGAKELPSDVNLIVYVDRKIGSKLPYIAKVDKDGWNIMKSYSEDFYSTNKSNMKEIMSWVFTSYPASSYALTLWGHGCGWIMESDKFTASAKTSSRRKAYGADTGVNNSDGGDSYWKYINIPTLAEVLSSQPHLDYIFFDCCQMQCAEVAYELKSVCDYIIGSSAEIPGTGAPYDDIVPVMFSSKEEVGKEIVDNYINNISISSYGGLPLAVVKTDAMDNLAKVTSNVLDTIMPHYTYPTNIPLSDVIYYGNNGESANKPVFYDIRNFMRKYLSANDFTIWDDVFQKAVIYAIHPQDIRTSLKPDWMANELSTSAFYNFTMNDENYGGMSIFIPQTSYDRIDSSKYLNLNTSIQSLKWSSVVNWTKWGWE